MSKVIGIDTSNYTTSVAVFDTGTNEIVHSKRLLPVKSGEVGLRQSDAVFNHIKQFPQLISDVSDMCKGAEAVGVSVKPRWIEGSYMPCFLVGEAIAESICAVSGAGLFKTSHQIGHILAALYSCKRLDYIKKKQTFIAFHVSGGTTDMLLCRSDDDRILDIEDIGHSLDLKAGQVIDRTGVMLGLDFPCGREIEKLAGKSRAVFKIRPVMKDTNCCLSGIENQCRKLYESGAEPCDVSLFCLESVYEAISAMTGAAIKKYGKLPVVYAGGVMSDRLIAGRLRERFDGCFAEPEFSCDNAAGAAVFAAIRKGSI